MFDKKVIGYGCVVSSYHSVRENRFLSEEEISWRRQTKIAEEIKKLRNLFLAEENILIDVIGGSYRYRHHFEECLKTMSRGDSIVIANINSLGLNNNELLKNYRRLYERKIGLLLPDYSLESAISPISTTDFSFSPINIIDSEFEEKCKLLSFTKIISNRGRKSLKITPEFKVIYWLYERYVIDPPTAFKNKYFNICKNTFRRLCELYENSDEYDIELEEQSKVYEIDRLPKRFGIITPAIENVIRDVARGVKISDACALHGVKFSETQFIRYNLKYYTKKAHAMKITDSLRDYDLIESLQPRYEP